MQRAELYTTLSDVDVMCADVMRDLTLLGIGDAMLVLTSMHVMLVLLPNM